jgi:hypothetical protein
MFYTAAIVPVIEATRLVSCIMDANRTASTPRIPSSSPSATFAELYKVNKEIAELKRPDLAQVADYSMLRGLCFFLRYPASRAMPLLEVS